ncbi:hypothetical protein MLD38_004835 [Melastoma candidum]|uniref:Uncharacterized protein n=1 Tax=Melastoma candidum TaxID=119954 RepID=A0ACB9S8H6_9MYRT|nr:hypothetical protein MLD38_004835 [Melastoma candidum]
MFTIVPTRPDTSSNEPAEFTDQEPIEPSDPTDGLPSELPELRPDHPPLERTILGELILLKLSKQVISETLRMGKIIVRVMGKATKDVQVKGYFIPKGWRVFTYFRLVHLDENNYDWPYQFNPWRWQDRDMSSCTFTPFGGAQRLCLGLDLARLEAAVFLHHLVAQFSWVAEPDTVANFPTVRMNK